MNKINVDENFWYIENFLSADEIQIILKECLEENSGSFSEGGWLFKSDSVQREINNIAIKVLVKSESREIFDKENGVFDRIRKVTSHLGEYRENYTLQKFIPISPKDWYGNQLALDFHHEDSDERNFGMTAGIIIYLNDEFKGGDLVFKNKNFKLKPKAGMFVCIPVTEEYSHAVSHVLEKERITLYGHVWKSTDLAPNIEPKDYRVSNDSRI